MEDVGQNFLIGLEDAVGSITLAGGSGGADVGTTHTAGSTSGRTLIRQYRWNREDGTVIGDHINVDFHEDGLHITIKGFPFRYEVVGDMPDLNTGLKIVSTKERPLLLPYPATFEVTVSQFGDVSVFSRP